MFNKRYIKSIKRGIFCFDFFSSILVSISFRYILERKDKKWFKRDIIVLISFLIIFVSISFLVNIGKEMSLPGFRTSGIFLFSFTVEFQWLEHLWNHENMFEAGVVRANECLS